MTALGPVGVCAAKACVWEATARKPGNVHRFADFDDLSHTDFMLAASVLAPELDRASSRPLGETILAGVEASSRVCRSNANLGIVLLLAPLAALPDERFPVGLTELLADTTEEDARLTYRAIRLAMPGGLGEVEEADVADEPTVTLVETMRLAADRDSIARQYVEGFAELFEFGVPALLDGVKKYDALESAIVHCHLAWLARCPDSLIARKFGPDVAYEVSRRAGDILRTDRIELDREPSSLREFDRWLRNRENRYNRGTTADLAAATLFCALRLGHLSDELSW